MHWGLVLKAPHVREAEKEQVMDEMEAQSPEVRELRRAAAALERQVRRKVVEEGVRKESWWYGSRLCVQLERQLMAVLRTVEVVFPGVQAPLEAEEVPV